MSQRMHKKNGRCAHTIYQMTCEDLDQLMDRADGGCEICGIPGEQTPHGSLHIDHDAYEGDWAVRGLLCSHCNTQLDSNVQNLNGARVAAYLASPWYRQKLDQLGIPLSGVQEPTVGSEVRSIDGKLWHHTEDGWGGTNYHGYLILRKSWEDLNQKYGPHNLSVSLTSTEYAPDLTNGAGKRLADAVANYNAAIERARIERDDKLFEIHLSGVSQSDIIRVTGYSRETVRQLLKGAEVRAARRAAKKET